MLAIDFLILHGLIGGFDVLWNHEFKERLPAQPWAAAEQRLHSARELVFAALFLGLAWWQWHGALAAVIAALVLAELGVTLRDAALELRTRTLALAEQLSHVLLFVNFGVFAGLIGLTLLQWWPWPAALQLTVYGWRSWVLTGLGLLALLWSVRDGYSAHKLAQGASDLTPPAKGDVRPVA